MSGTGPMDEHLDHVLAATGPAASDRTREVLGAAVRHLHAFMREVGLTRDEWQEAVRFLTAVGHTSVGGRQEFILLSDVLGASMLMEMLDEEPSLEATEPTVLGPFYLPGAPQRALGDSIVDDPATGGEPLIVSGVVRSTSGAAIAGATLDVWQVQPNHRYDIEDDPQKRNLRAVFTTGADGAWSFRTVRPVDYQIPHDGPVGELLCAADRGAWRPAHLHLMVKAPDHHSVVTHLFDATSEHLHDDAVFGVRDSIITSMDGGVCRYDIVLAPVG